jgi:hypothetical protein
MKKTAKQGLCWAIAALCVASAGQVGHAQGSDMNSQPKAGMSDDAKDARMLIQTLSEEKTEIQALAAQQAAFRKLGGSENNRIARMFGVWIKQHKAGGPLLEKLIHTNGGNPAAAKILKAPVLGDREMMLKATHKDHEAAVMTSQMRHGMTKDNAIKNAMRKRANLARKHIRQMKPYHKDMDKHGDM